MELFEVLVSTFAVHCGLVSFYLYTVPDKLSSAAQQNFTLAKGNGTFLFWTSNSGVSFGSLPSALIEAKIRLGSLHNFGLNFCVWTSPVSPDI